MSPWPEGVRLGDLIPPANLNEHLERVRLEIQADAMTVDLQMRGKFVNGEPFVLMGTSGADEVGRPRHAVRVVTRHGIVLAVGPGAALDREGRSRTRLLEALAPGGAWRSGTDLNADGLPDVVLVADDGTYEMWGVHPQGASPYPMHGVVAPTTAMDVDEDGRPDPAGLLRIAGADAISPRVLEVMLFHGGEYRSDGPAVRRWHAAEAARLRAPTAEVDGGAMAPVAPRDRASAALELAWHDLKSGAPRSETFSQLDATMRPLLALDGGLAQASLKWRAVLLQLMPTGDERR